MNFSNFYAGYLGLKQNLLKRYELFIHSIGTRDGRGHLWPRGTCDHGHDHRSRISCGDRGLEAFEAARWERRRERESALGSIFPGVRWRLWRGLGSPQCPQHSVSPPARYLGVWRENELDDQQHGQLARVWRRGKSVLGNSPAAPRHCLDWPSQKRAWIS